MLHLLKFSFTVFLLITMCLWTHEVQSSGLPALRELYTVAMDASPDDELFLVEDPQIAVIAISSNGKLLASGDLEGFLRIWAVDSCDLLNVKNLVGPDDGKEASPWYVTAVAFSPDGRWLAVGGRDRAIRLWDIVLGFNRRETVGFIAHDGHVRNLSFNPNGEYLASSGHDGKVKLWDAKGNFEEVLAIQVTKQIAFSFAFSPDGLKIVSAGLDDMSVGIWALESRTLVRQYPLLTGRPRGVAYSPNGEFVAAAIEGGIEEGGTKDSSTVRVWSTHSKKDIYSFSNHNGSSYDKSAMAVEFSNDGKYLAAGGNDGSIYLWNMDSGKLIRKMSIEDIWATEKNNGRKIKVRVQGGGTIQSLQFSSDGQLLVSGGYRNFPRIWDWHTGKILKEFRLKGCEGSIPIE